jgi:cardiolipin synthase C
VNAARRRCQGAGLLPAVGLIALSVLPGCASDPPGSHYPRSASVALATPADTAMGAQFDASADAHGGMSGYRILSLGVDGLLARVQIIDAAERTLDLQYFIFRGDETGRLITDALLRAADRGVRVRVLIDDGSTAAGDEQIIALDGHPDIQIRIFNPFAYRGHSTLRRAVEFLFSAGTLDYRMHNKLLVADNAVALIGGRNIGNQYFQVDPHSQYADDDVFAAGPVAARLSAVFDEFWNSRFAVPAAALYRQQRSAASLAARRAEAAQYAEKHLQTLSCDGVDYAARVAGGEPYGGLRSGELPLAWAPAEVISDSPDKKNAESGAHRGRLMARSLMKAAGAAGTEMIMVTPYLVPAADEWALLVQLRARQVPVRILTNSLESAPDLVAQAGYTHYRNPLLKSGVELHELRAMLGNPRGSGETARISSYGNYSLHAKLFVFDRRKLFVGSMNYDQRSKHLNTEIGLLIDSPALAQQTAARFEHMVQPDNAYSVVWRDQIAWDTVENGKAIEYSREPARSEWQRLQLAFLSWLPIRGEL